MKKSEAIRVIGCQGSIQLITATNVVLNHGAKSEENFQNFLVVYELFTSQGQSQDFFLFIKKLAESGPLRFQNIIYIRPEQLKELQAEFTAKGLLAAQKMLCTIIGIDHADELYLTSNWHLGNKILMHCMPSSMFICYGDSIGIHIPEGYFDQQTFLTGIKNLPLIKGIRYQIESIKLFLKYPSRKPRFNVLKPKNFDKGYYQTLNLTKQRPKWPFEFISKQLLLETFHHYVSAASSNLISDEMLHRPQIAILMTTNFSEAGKMTLENEINGYDDYVKKHIDPNTTLILKPHPRDSQEKLQRLMQVLKLNYRVELLDRKNDFFMPFELVLILLCNSDFDKLKNIQFHTFSSACLSIKILFDQNPHVGFGESLIMKYFNTEHQLKRIQHEEDLRKLLTNAF